MCVELLGWYRFRTDSTLFECMHTHTHKCHRQIDGTLKPLRVLGGGLTLTSHSALTFAAFVAWCVFTALVVAPLGVGAVFVVVGGGGAARSSSAPTKTRRTK